MSGVLALSEALARGGRVVWDAPKPRLLVPPSLRPKVEADREAVREILRRAALFRDQAAAFIRDGRPLPTLAFPEYDGRTRGGCISCGAPPARVPSAVPCAPWRSAWRWTRSRDRDRISS